MQRSEVSGAVRPLYVSLGVKGLIASFRSFLRTRLRARSDLSVTQTAQTTHSHVPDVHNEDELSDDEPGDVAVPF